MKDSFGEDAVLLYPTDGNERFTKFWRVHSETPIMKGVASQLKRWPSDLFFAFLAACLVMGSLLLLIFVTVAFCLPAVIDNRVVTSFQIAETPNVYFLKMENHTWSRKEFCYIEIAAREHSDLKVYLINIFREEPTRSIVDNMTKSESMLSYSTKNTSETLHLDLSLEKQLEKQLVSGNANVRSIDISVETFFKGSILSNIAKSLNDGLLEIAARAQLLWNSPGIVLNPNMYCNLKSMERFLCKNKENCLPDNLATFELKNGIQATGVPCQAFLGFLLHEISHNETEGYTFDEAIKKYCPRLHYCPEIRILDLKSTCSLDELNCPSIYSSIILRQDDVEDDHENFIT